MTSIRSLRATGAIGLAAADRTWPLPVLSLSLALLLTACATSPLGRTQLNLFSEQDMRAMGEAAFDEMLRELPASDSISAQAYVECVANATIDALGDSGEDWDVAVFDSQDVNAFALPGGNIGVYEGLLDVAQNQHQLATVIGHEIGHVIAAHANERLSTTVLTDVGIRVVAAISGSPSPQRDRALAALGLGVQVGVLLPFSRTQEQEADLVGIGLMARAGFDPRESTRLWRNMERASERSPPEFLSTHPSSGSRIEALDAHMAEALALYSQALANGRRPECGQVDASR